MEALTGSNFSHVCFAQNSEWHRDVDDLRKNQIAKKPNCEKQQQKPKNEKHNIERKQNSTKH